MSLNTRNSSRNAAGAPGRAFQTIQPIHTRIPGRFRFRITALYRSLPIRHRLEAGLRGVEGIRAALGNELTGRLLVVVDRRHSIQDVTRLILNILGPSPRSTEITMVPAAAEHRHDSAPITSAPALPGSHAPDAVTMPAGLLASSPLVLLPIAFVRTFSTGLLQALPITLLFTTSIAGLGLVVGKQEGWSRSEALYFAFATASTVGYNELRPTKTSTKILSIAIGLQGLLLTGMVTALGFVAAQKAFQTLP